MSVPDIRDIRGRLACATAATLLGAAAAAGLGFRVCPLRLLAAIFADGKGSAASLIVLMASGFTIGTSYMLMMAYRRRRVRYDLPRAVIRGRAPKASYERPPRRRAA